MPSSTALQSVMTGAVVVLGPDQTLAEAAAVLAEHGIGAAPVVDDAGVVIGLLRDEDLLATEARLHVPTTIAILGVDVAVASLLLSRTTRKLCPSEPWWKRVYRTRNRSTVSCRLFGAASSGVRHAMRHYCAG